ncbi:MAG: aminoacyl-histidine dipeptidase [Clostridia bacterium]|nr:aminoacyl-histidine dipeptidase [Clostridia bacterium]
MDYNQLEPKKVFSYFKNISNIPRGSGNEAAVAKYVYDTVTALGHEAHLDEANNVFVRAKASPGYENRAPIMIQGHLDMVCEANRATQHDFLTDPIRLLLDGDRLHADGTTLGADDGVAVAVMLAILDSPELPRPELECLFTTDEETGLTGMRAFDPSVLRARRMLNLDSATEGEAIVSCAGGVRSHVYFPIETAPAPKNYTVCTLTVGGLFGGHSGEDIHLGRTGAIAAFARLLYTAQKVCDVRLANVVGGSRDNAIPRECSADLAIADPAAFEAAVRAEEAKIRAELTTDDVNFHVTLEPASSGDFLTADASGKLTALLRLLPNGVHAMSRQIPGLVETSSNLGVIRPADNAYEIVVLSRSSVESKIDDMEHRVECAAKLVGGTYEHINRYPGWDFTVGSPLQKLFLDTYRDLYGKEARILGIHAGLECGLLKHKVPDMDMISIAPDIRDLHSPDESLSVSSMARVWKLVCEMLKNA